MNPNMPMDAVNWFIMFFSLTVAWYVMRDISRRLGEALKMRKYYLLYDLCEEVLAVCIVVIFAHFVLRFQLPGVREDALPKAVKLAFTAAAAVLVAVTLKYWGWIVPEVLALRKK